MKLKKLLSFVTAAAISASCFAGWTFTASAESSTAETMPLVTLEAAPIKIGDVTDFSSLEPAEFKETATIGDNMVVYATNDKYVSIREAVVAVNENNYSQALYLPGAGSFNGEEPVSRVLEVIPAEAGILSVDFQNVSSNERTLEIRQNGQIIRSKRAVNTGATARANVVANVPVYISSKSSGLNILGIRLSAPEEDPAIETETLYSLAEDNNAASWTNANSNTDIQSTYSKDTATLTHTNSSTTGNRGAYMSVSSAQSPVTFDFDLSMSTTADDKVQTAYYSISDALGTNSIYGIPTPYYLQIALTTEAKLSINGEDQTEMFQDYIQGRVDNTASTLSTIHVQAIVDSSSTKVKFSYNESLIYENTFNATAEKSNQYYIVSSVARGGNSSNTISNLTVTAPRGLGANEYYNLDLDKGKNWVGDAEYFDGALSIDSAANQSASVTFEKEAGSEYITRADAAIRLNDGNNSSAVYQLVDTAGNIITEIKLVSGFLYVNGDEISQHRANQFNGYISVIIDGNANIAYVKISGNENSTEVYGGRFDIDEETGGLKTVNLITDAGSSISISSLVVEDVTVPTFFFADCCVVNETDKTVAATIKADEPTSLALLRNYQTVTITAGDGCTDTVTGYEISNSYATAEYSAGYRAITAVGHAKGTLGPFKVSITDGNMTEGYTFTVTIVEAEARKPVPTASVTIEEIEEIERMSLFDITFDEEDAKCLEIVNGIYKLNDEEGSIVQNTSEITAIADTSKLTTSTAGTGETYRETNTTEKADAAKNVLTGGAFYSFLTPTSGTDIAANGYRGSRLYLDNEKVQRTDKIQVQYSFAFYNIVNTDSSGSGKIGMPFSISMTSEATEEGSIPYMFSNAARCVDVNADPVDLRGISKHLLTFFTGRPKRNSAGMHWTDMTNKLAYFDPLSASSAFPYGKYVQLTDLGDLAENDYNYFTVVADIDFANDLIQFTITRVSDDSAVNGKKQTITTTIPEHADWNGFIMASNKYDEGNTEDTNGVATEHYSYLDNITATKIGMEQLIDTTASTAAPLPTDAIALNGKNANAVNGLNDGNTWAFNKEFAGPEPNSEQGGFADYRNERNYIDYTGETTNDGTTYHLANMAGDLGVTAYIDFDFYLPKHGSGFNVYFGGQSDNSVGNTLTIGNAGISSWSGQKAYTAVYSNPLECSKWYSMSIIYDLNGSWMRVILKNNDNILAERDVYTRNLGGSSAYWRTFVINPNSVPDSGGDNTYPAHELSMATSYIANLRMYNRGTIKEYYPEGYTADEKGNALNTESQQDNGARTASMAVDFVANQVNETPVVDADLTKGNGTVPAPAKSKNGKTWNGEWELIYSNGDGAVSGTDGIYTEGSNATRLKYRPVYVDLPVEEAKFPEQDGYYYKTFYTNLPIMTDNYKTIDWFVFNGENNAFRMKGSFNLENFNKDFAGDGSYRIGYVVYNIPTEETIVNAVPQAHHEAADNITEFDERNQTPPSGQPTAMPLPSDAPAAPTATAKPDEPAQID